MGCINHTVLGGNYSLHLYEENCCSPPAMLHRLSPLATPGPTVLEVFNTLLRQLRLSIDYALTGSYDCAVGVSTKIIKEHEERMFQEAVIKTIGGVSRGAWRRCGLCWWVSALCICRII